jgi:hypothetical protein
LQATGKERLFCPLAFDYNPRSMGQVRPISTEDRNLLASLLDRRSAADATAAYYALHHPASKVKLYGYFATNDKPSGFLAMANTGLDLFRPVAVPFAAQPFPLIALMREGLGRGRPALVHLPADQMVWIEGVLEWEDARTLELMRLSPQEFEPLINVLVVEALTPTGWPRYEIRSRDTVVAAAGLNWMGEYFAEVYLEVQPEARERRLGESVLAAIVSRLLSERRVPLYLIEAGDNEALLEASALGFRPTGVRTVIGHVIMAGDI